MSSRTAPVSPRSAEVSPIAPPTGPDTPSVPGKAPGTIRLVYRVSSSGWVRAAAWAATSGKTPERTAGVTTSTALTPWVPDLDMRSIEVPADQADGVIASLQSRFDVQWAERDAPVYLHTQGGFQETTPQRPNVMHASARVTNDTLQPYQWSLWSARAYDAWTIARTANPSSQRVMVAVIDSGVEYWHEDLYWRMAPVSTWARCDSGVCKAYDFNDNTSKPWDDFGHGTHVAGIIAAQTGNGVGIAGIAGELPVEIMPIRVFDADGTGTVAAFVSAVAWAAQHGARIINYSGGSVYSSFARNAAIDYASSSGVLVVAAAGNCGDDNYAFNGCTKKSQPSWPSAYADTVDGWGKVLPVTALAQYDYPWLASTMGTYVEQWGISATGGCVLSTYMKEYSGSDEDWSCGIEAGYIPPAYSGYAYMSGTSMAAPQVSGAAALLWSTYPSLTREQVRDLLRQGARTDSMTQYFKPFFGAGYLDANNSLRYAAALAPPATSTTIPTAVPVPTLTPVPTATLVPTATRVPTTTLSPTVTASQTASLTPTPSPSNTSTATPTRSPTASSTSTPSRTATPTATATRLPTRTLPPNSTPASLREVPLGAGWNLVTLALQPQFDPDAAWLCETINGNLPGSAVEVVRYLSGGWDSHLCALTANNFMLDIGVGYFVRTTRATSWAYSGTPITQLPANVLTAGWNVIGLPLSTGTAATILSQIDTLAGGVGTAPEMDRWTDGQWDGHISGLPVNVFTIETGRGYAVRVNRQVTWDPVSLIPTRTSTATSTATSSATLTPSPSRTASATATATQTASSTSSATPSPSTTSTPTPTTSSTATASASPTSVPSSTITASPTSTQLPANAFTSLEAGDAHTCGLVSGGTAYCWGSNWAGQLGDGTSGSYNGDSSHDRTAPVAVSGGRTYTALVAGGQHTCGLVSGGTAYCWGGNGSGQLGDGMSGTNWNDNSANRLAPVVVSGGRTYTALVAGWRHTCGLVSGGTAYCWGWNVYGQLGDGTSGTDRLAPVAVSGGRTYTALVAGGGHTCGLVAGGMAYCWGFGLWGQLGDPYSENRPAPMAVSGGRTYTALVAGGQHTCGLVSGGTAYCWGSNWAGQLGDGTRGAYNGDPSADRHAPVAVSGGRIYTALVAGGQHTCGLVSGGTAYCWGSNANGRLGDGTSGTDRSVPTAVDVSAIAVPTPVPTATPTARTPIPAASPTSSPTASPTSMATPTQTASPTPTLSASPPTARFNSLAAGTSHTCGLVAGEAYCWGANTYGQLGDGTSGNGSNGSNRTTPVRVSGGLRFTSLVLGHYHTCGLVSGGTAYCWGYNGLGLLGDGTTQDRSAPVAVSGGLTFTSLVVSAAPHTCGLATDGRAYCWGFNQYGQLGDGTTINRSAPVAVSGGRTFISLAAGAEHTCGLLAGGAAYCWGENVAGQLGDGTNERHSLPVAVSGGRTFTNLATGSSSGHTCGLEPSGAAYCWGYNWHYELGDSTRSDRNVPVAGGGGMMFTSLVAGGTHNCGLDQGGIALCWGGYEQGQLGEGSANENPPYGKSTPVAVSGRITFTSLVAGGGHTCGLGSNGTAYCWGRNVEGQLGDGTTTDRRTPVQVDVSAIPLNTASLSISQSVAMTSKSSSPSPSWTATVSVISTNTFIVSPTSSSTASITPHPPVPAGGTGAGQPALPTQTVTPTANSSPSVITQVNP